MSTGAVEYANCMSTKGWNSSSNECLGNNTDGEASVLKLWGIWSIPSLPLLPDPLRPRSGSIC